MVLQRDHLWKTAFLLWMPDFVKFFFPKRYDEVDWTKKILFLDKELNSLQVDSRPKDRIADVLVMLHLKSGGRVFILLHIEIQGYSDKEYSFRVHQMRYRIEDKLGTNPVMLSIFTDDDPDFHPTEYVDETWGSGCKTFFNTYKVMDHPPITYLDPDSPVALIMEVVYASTQIKTTADDRGIMKLFIPIVKKLLSKNYSKKDIRFLISFIEGHIKFGNPDNYRKFEEKIETMVKFQTTAQIAAYCLDPQRQIKDLKKELENGLQKDLKKANQEKERERQQKERERVKAEQERAKAEQERQEKERTRERGVMVMLNKGIGRDVITEVFGITLEDIDTIQEKYKDKRALKKLLNGQLKSKT